MERVRVLKKGRGLRPDIWLVRVEGQEAILKDFGPRAFWVRCTIGRWLTRRECHIYGLLEGIAGIPRLYGRVGPWALMLGYVEDRRSQLSAQKAIPREFFEELRQLVDRIHERGVAHGDLRRQTNILVTPERRPCLVDFAAAFEQGRPWNRPRRWIFEQLCQVDRDGIAKLKRRWAPEWLTPEERHQLEHPPLLARIERRARRLVGR